MILRLLIGRTGRPDVRLERCKMLASGTQLVAIGVFAAAIVAPSFNPARDPRHRRVAGCADRAIGASHHGVYLSAGDRKRRR